MPQKKSAKKSTAKRTANQGLRHITSINDLTNSEIETLFAAADRYLSELGHSAVKHRIARSAKIAAGKILATLFYEPSTRTRLSFESAALRLGGGTISSSDPATSSAAKGESLADTVRVISSYADVLVIRHPRDGAAKLASEFADIPVINGGDGAHEHPTQTLCDLFTLRREKSSLKGLNVVISGDLKGSRTVHSFVYALARFAARIEMMPGALGMELPGHVDWRLREELGQRRDGDARRDAVYVAAKKPSRAKPDVVDILYMTRFQKERWSDTQRNDYPTVDKAFLATGRYKHASVLHPLPRVGELSTELDEMPGAAYFRQAAYGVPVRMALIAALLDLEPGLSLKKFAKGFEASEYPVHVQPRELGLDCPNPNCITHDEHDGKYTTNGFYVVRPDRLRCFYCETDIEDLLSATKDGDDAFFASESAARKSGYRAHARAAE
ncbi:MAG TPA: aspartate carbamoyltransferase [Rhizomicrobium sp.]|nr:aspartate carbamoyltransferase [Rhizomicrobium sp.]